MVSTHIRNQPVAIVTALSAGATDRDQIPARQCGLHIERAPHRRRPLISNESGESRYMSSSWQAGIGLCRLGCRLCDCGDVEVGLQSADALLERSCSKPLTGRQPRWMSALGEFVDISADELRQVAE